MCSTIMSSQLEVRKLLEKLEREANFRKAIEYGIERQKERYSYAYGKMIRDPEYQEQVRILQKPYMEKYKLEFDTIWRTLNG